MTQRATLVSGLIAGGVTALVLLLAAVALLPDPAARATASPRPTAGGSSAPSQIAASPVGTMAASIGGPFSRVGEHAPPLKVPQLGGGTVDLAALAGKPVWIDFMQTTCAPCRDELVAMNDFAARYADTGLVVLAVDISETEGTVAAFVQTLNLRFPVGLDGDGAAKAGWALTSIPSHVWIDRDGVVQAQATGPLTKDAMAADLAKILPTVQVAPS